MTTALVLGGAECLHVDLAAYVEAGHGFAGVVACNDAGAEWPGRVDAAVYSRTAGEHAIR